MKSLLRLLNGVGKIIMKSLLRLLSGVGKIIMKSLLRLVGRAYKGCHDYLITKAGIFFWATL